MKKVILLFVLLISLSNNINAQNSNDTVVVSGIVSNFEGKPIDSAYVEIKNADFSTEYETYTNDKGEYNLSVKKGKYLALASIKLSEYPNLNPNALPKSQQRLEFWCWNLIVTDNLVLDIHYNRLEIYGVNIFQIQGATPGYTIYCRPMSLTKAQLDPNKNRDFQDAYPNPDELSIKVDINGELVKVNSKEKVKEFVSDGICYGYLIHTDLPKQKVDNPFDIFRIEMEDLKNGDKGEAMYFMEKKHYN